LVTVVERARPSKTETEQRFSIAPIGSCRITAPLRLAQSELGITLNKTRNYGYCHSPAEAVQMVKFMRGELDLPRRLWPLIARGVDFDATMQSTHTKADLYVIELSSAKEITIDGVCVQLNYLTAAYRSFFESAARARHFWDHAAAGDQAAIDRNLSGAQIGKDDVDVLRRIRLRYVSEEDLRVHVKTLLAQLSNVLFVTHVNARQTTGAPLASRAHFIDMVKRVVTSEGGHVYDPTALMIEVGQSAAIADHSEGLAHYTDDFAQRILVDWQRNTIGPLIDKVVMGGDANQATSVLSPHVDAMIAHGQLDTLQERLDALANARPDLKVINRLRYQVAASQSDASAAYVRLKELLDQDPSDLGTLRKLRDVAIEMQRYETALGCIETLTARGHPMSARQLIHLGQKAMAAHKVGVAITMFQNAFLQPGKPRKAARLFAQAALDHAPAVLDELSPQRQTQLLSHLPAEVQLRVLVHLQVKDPEDSVDLSQLDVTDLQVMTTVLSDKGEVPRAAVLIQRWLREHAEDDRLPIALRPTIDGWLAQASDQTSTTDKIALLVAARRASGSYPPTRRAIQDMRKTILAKTKALAADANAVALSHLAAEVARFPLPLPEVALAQARLHFVAGQFDAALRRGKVAAENWDDNISVWVLLMRAAAKLCDADGTVQAAKRVLSLSDHSTQRLEAEALDRLRQIESA